LQATGRNSPCPCGSGRKYKYCCLQRPAAGVVHAHEQQSLVLHRSMFEDARNLYVHGRVQQAESACEALLALDPGHVSALALAARIAGDSGRLTHAYQLLTRAVTAAPEDAIALRELGVLEIRLGRAQNAVATLSKATALDHRSPPHDDLAVALLLAGRVEDAEAACRRMLDLDPRRPAAYITLAECQRRRGLPALARGSLEKALQLAPDSLEARIALADLHMAVGEFPAAAARYREAIAARAHPPGLHARLATALKEMGDPAGALEALETALAVEPDSAECSYLLAQTLLENGRIPEAIARAEQALRLKADYTDARVLHAAALALRGEVDAGVAMLAAGSASVKARGESLTLIANHLIASGHVAGALQCLKRRLELQPDEAATRHAVAALSGVNPDHAPPEFVRQLFDSYAEGFDGSLLRGLAYSVPRELGEAVLASSELSRPWDVLDLGCGTGLVGAELAARARSLVGVDLSVNMIESSRARGCYTGLVCADLLEMLQQSAPSCFDVVTAGDVFIYVGSLDAVVPAVRRVLRPGGTFAFSAEALEQGRDASQAPPGVGYWLHSRARYAHRLEYLSALAARHDFEVRLVRDTRIRFEDRRPVPGWIIVWSAA
jgi:predicted TPR repeat methyltransferase